MKKTFLAYSFACLILAGLTLVIRAAPSEPELPPRHPHHDNWEELEFLNTDLSQLKSREIAEAAFVVPWSKLAFQSYRNGNWDIYLAKGDGSNQTRLTFGSASYIHPRLNRGATRVIFASNRTGNYEILAMNSDGTRVVQLTTDNADDVYPCWSPDGERIVFQSYRDGQSEIYVIDADGSNLARLTWDSDYDGVPDWSPDGAKIAFVSRRTGGYRVWTMNVDGSGLTQLSSQPYSGNPVWSPDSSQIAYNSDEDGNGWQELWLMDADGSNPRRLYAPLTSKTDAWARSWSPDGRYVAFTSISFVFYQGNWYWSEAKLFAWDTIANWVTALSNQGTDWHPGWQTTDASPPESQMNGLSLYSKVADFTTSWSGSDIGAAGVASYDVQYRVGDSGIWTDWLTYTQKTSASFPGVGGTTVYFQSRARDNSSNLEEWPIANKGDAFTTLYTWQITGTVRDTRGIPIPYASLIASPQALSNLESDSNGFYKMYLQMQGSHYLTATKPGYGNVAAIALDLTADSSVNHVLPPFEDQMLNGGFESGTLANWQSGGTIPAKVLQDIAYSGHSGTLLGQRINIPLSQNLSHSKWGADMPTAAYDSSGILHIAWRDVEDPEYIAYTNCAPNRACQLTQMLFTGGFPALAVGPDDKIHLTWKADGYLMYASQSLGEEWSAAQVIDASSGWMSGYSALAVDGNGVPNVVWSHDRAIYYAYLQDDGTWSASESVSDSGIEPAIAIANNGDVHVVWGPGYTLDWLAYRMRSASGTWEELHQIEELRYSRLPGITVDDEENAHIVWTDDGIIEYICYDAVDGWSNIEEIYEGGDPEIAVLADGSIVAAWIGFSSGQQISYLNDDGTWASPKLVFGFGWGNMRDTVLASHPTINELSLVADGHPGGTWDVYMVRFGLEREKSGHSKISQAVTIPADLRLPTLSFLFQNFSEDTRENDQLTVYVDNGPSGTTRTPLTTIDTPSEWTHAWFDMSKWLGKTVTVTFDLFMVSNGLHTWTYIDQVSLGSWLTPLPTAVNPHALEARASTIVTITGENFVVVPPGSLYIEGPEVRLDDVLLTDTRWITFSTLTTRVPGTLSPGIYDLRVINPGGQEGVLSNGVVVGKQVFLPLLLKHLLPRLPDTSTSW